MSPRRRLALVAGALLGPCAILVAAAPAPGFAIAPAPVLTHDTAALQRGAELFVRYCLTCHPASLLRWNRLVEIGYSQAELMQELLPSGARIGDPMTVAMRREDAERWFGMQPPDLSLAVRSRTTTTVHGRDWVYAYLRGFYRDRDRPTGWNNVVFPNVAMHHVLADLQGVQSLGPDQALMLARPGRMTPDRYDAMVADVVAFMEYMSEPTARTRRRVGVYVLLAGLVLVGFAFALKPPPRRRAASTRG